MQKRARGTAVGICLELQTISLSYKEICEGEDPWIPLGNFMNDFFGNFPDQRAELVKDAIQMPQAPTIELQRWAVFCAASVEYLCQKYDVPCPAWANNSIYTLAEPWYYSLGAHKPRVRERLTRETPEPFIRRNIYCGNRIFANKYEQGTERLQSRSA
ncbi:MAG TPA: hypothetical protein VHZ51_19970 [Ktedonobacteraceae bacterium]|nr:hypothetical protein [Ktedonobacteraceae bacterium]